MGGLELKVEEAEAMEQLEVEVKNQAKRRRRQWLESKLCGGRDRNRRGTGSGSRFIH